MIITAHGESWEVAASRAVSALVKKVIEEHNTNNGPFLRRDTVDLRYTPGNPDGKTVIIPLSTIHTTLSDQPPENNLQNGDDQNPYFGKIVHY